jgi:hypothetical protein
MFPELKRVPKNIPIFRTLFFKPFQQNIIGKNKIGKNSNDRSETGQKELACDLTLRIIIIIQNVIQHNII